ncbi:hypothetical protein [Emticicia sp. C21]|uniref:hypothetical protein n=1 Tax=Emticicia sp. C21 TaxID=2302915 RepID=UPI000E34F79D|nr:hypothetical protein [Emticicia sp. C21]RFS15819.1 hypothetical protein D0T08_12995 [Emticicia sp. C21]
MKNIHIYISKISLIFVVLLLGNTAIKAQDEKGGFFRKHKFVNMTEFGGLFGRIKYQANYYGGWYPYPYPGNYPDQYQIKNKVNLSMQTFNGIYIDRKTAAGITIGVDGYGETVLMPIALGVRRSILQKKEGGSGLQAGIDAGYSTTWLNEDNTGFHTKGGLLVSPTVGYRLPMRNGSAWLINIGYRFQRAEYKMDRNGNEVYWSETNEVRKYKRMVLRLGVEF